MKSTARLALLAIVVGANVASAQQIQNSTTGLTAPQTTIRFDEFGVGTNVAVTNQYSSMGATFKNLCQDNSSNYFGTGPSLVNFTCAGTVNGRWPALTILFTQAVRGSAFEYITNPGTSLFQFFLSGSMVGSFSAASHFPPNNTEWYGWNNLTHDEIRISVSGDANGAQGIDNLQFSAVPEPASMALMGTGLAALGAWKRRRRNKANTA